MLLRSLSEVRLLLSSFLFFFLQTLQILQILSCVRCEMGSSPASSLVIELDSSDSSWARIQTEHGVRDIRQITEHFYLNKNLGCQYE